METLSALTQPIESWSDASTSSDQSWMIEQEGFEPSRERELETIFSIGNGYLGIRGALLTPIPTSQPDLFISGIYGKKVSVLPYSEVEFMTSDRAGNPYVELVPFPSPFRMTVFIGGRALNPEQATLTHFKRILDLRRGALHEFYRYVDGDGRATRIRSCRVAVLENPHLLLHDLEITAENHSERLDIESDYVTSDFSLQHPHLKMLPTPPAENIADFHAFETDGSKFKIGLAVRTLCAGREANRSLLRVAAREGEPLEIRRMISVFTSRDGDSPERRALDLIGAQSWQDCDKTWARIERTWARFWEKADVDFEGRPDLTQAQRFNSFQLRIGASRDPWTSVSARTLTGRSYEGHVFWDTEIFALPFYLYTEPKIARSLLLYRYHTLDGARKRARDHGQTGASFAWESTVTGEDVTPKKIIVEGTSNIVPIFTGTQQIHVTADVAHAVRQYWRATQDAEFLRDYGSEILFETARFWAHRVTERDHSFHIDEVIGPDEYHHSVNDNAYTNWMARENLRHALWSKNWLGRFYPLALEELLARLHLDPSDFDAWESVANKLFVPGPNSHGVIEQFEGYFDLRDVPIQPGEKLKAPISRLLNWQEINASKLIKQADVLMIPFLFPNALPQEIVRSCYDYYEPKTDHGSSLSPSVHAAVAAQLGLKDPAIDYWETGLDLDLFNIMGNSGLGFHAACAGGSWQALIFHMCRISESGETLVQNTNPHPPVLPMDCGRILFSLTYRDKVVRFQVERKVR